jgi:hypothetical protein
MKPTTPIAGAIHEAAFRHALARDLGIEWERPVNGIADIRGISKRVLEAFSRRSREIDAYLRSRREGTPVSFVRSLRDGQLFPSVGRPPAQDAGDRRSSPWRQRLAQQLGHHRRDGRLPTSSHARRLTRAR